MAWPSISEWSDIATVAGVPAILLSVFFAHRQLRSEAEAAQGAIFLEVRKMLGEFHDLHFKLFFGKPLSDLDVLAAAPYLGLLEHCEHLIQRRVLSQDVFNDIYGLRVKAIVESPELVNQTLLNPDAKWPTFHALVERLGYSTVLEATRARSAAGSDAVPEETFPGSPP